MRRTGVPLLLFALSLLPHPAAAAPAPPPGLHLLAPPMVDVGDIVLLSLAATRWPEPASAAVTFLSPHHGFAGRMIWDPLCSCFRISVQLALRKHSEETARAVATVTVGTRRYTATTFFRIRGLAPSGKTLSPDGPAFLTAWPADSRPTISHGVQLCAWVRTADSRGIPNVRVVFTPHFPDGSSPHWTTSPTRSTGVTCTHHTLTVGEGGIAGGAVVPVDVRAGTLKTRTRFTLRG